MVRAAVKQEFEKGRVVPIFPFPAVGADVLDLPKLTLLFLDPESEWEAEGELRKKLSEWTRQRGSSPRLYPAALVWLVRKPRSS